MRGVVELQPSKNGSTALTEVDKLLDSKKKTCLQLARERGNHRCVEILAPLFGLQVLEKGLQDGSRNEQETWLMEVDALQHVSSWLSCLSSGAKLTNIGNKALHLVSLGMQTRRG